MNQTLMKLGDKKLAFKDFSDLLNKKRLIYYNMALNKMLHLNKCENQKLTVTHFNENFNTIANEIMIM